MKTELIMSYTARLDILERVNAVKDLIDLMVGEFTKKGRPHKSKNGYEIFLPPKQFEEILSTFNRMSDLKKELSPKEVVNPKDWIELIELMQQFPNHFIVEGFSILKFYVASTADLNAFKQKLTRFVDNEKFDLEKSSVEHLEKQNKLSAKERLKQDLVKYKISLGYSLEALDKSEFEDYIIFDIVSEKYELTLSGVSEKTAKLIELNELGSYHIINTDDLESELLDRDIDDEIDGEVLFCQILIEGISEFKVGSKDHSLFELSLNERNNLQSKNLNKKLGELLADDLKDYGYNHYYFHLAAAPAQHTGVLLLKDKTSKSEILKNLTMIVTDNIYLGIMYKDEEESFDQGDLYKFKEVDFGLWTLDEIKKLNTNKVI
jgi:hypothetical protein